METTKEERERWLTTGRVENLDTANLCHGLIRDVESLQQENERLKERLSEQFANQYGMADWVEQSRDYLDRAEKAEQRCEELEGELSAAHVRRREVDDEAFEYAEQLNEANNRIRQLEGALHEHHEWARTEGHRMRLGYLNSALCGRTEKALAKSDEPVGQPDEPAEQDPIAGPPELVEAFRAACFRLRELGEDTVPLTMEAAGAKSDEPAENTMQLVYFSDRCLSDEEIRELYEKHSPTPAQEDALDSLMAVVRHYTTSQDDAILADECEARLRRRLQQPTIPDEIRALPDEWWGLGDNISSGGCRLELEAAIRRTEG